jgi:hypothetical protein
MYGRSTAAPHVRKIAREALTGVILLLAFGCRTLSR